MIVYDGNTNKSKMNNVAVNGTDFLTLSDRSKSTTTVTASENAPVGTVSAVLYKDIFNNYDILYTLLCKKNINVDMTLNEEVAKQNIEDIGVKIENSTQP